MLALASAAHAQTGERFLIAETAPNPEGDVLEVAAATGQFTRFLAAVETAGYAETLRGPGPFTIFAPTDEAFRRMDRRERERLMRPAQHDELLALLAYHVVPGRVTTASLRGGVSRREAANGHRVTLDARDGLRINDQLVVMPDIEARNGVLQGINSVLSPPVLVASR
jgi:uncharacterized surface protein with fasciclin (FAS1) repeats